MWKTTSILIGAVLILISLGIVMLGSTSLVQAQMNFHDPLFFVKRQIMWLLVGVLISLFLSRVDYEVFGRPAVAWFLYAFSVALLAAVLGWGVTVNGSTRWLGLGPLRMQPSEFAKFGVVVFLAWWLANMRRRVMRFWEGIAVPLGALGLVAGLVFLEPDFGTSMVIGAVGFAVVFAAGARIGNLLLAGTLGLTFFSVAVMRNAERMRRIIAFMNPQKYARNEAFQLLNAIYAFVIGGATGVGLGQSLQKRYYLPEAHTDFIFAIIGEELGVAGSLLVLTLFAAIFVCGIRISRRAPTHFGYLLGFGMTLTITLQALVNIGVVTGCLPTKGLPLPFISFGGSNLVVCMAMVGILVSIARAAGEQDGRPPEARAIRDRVHRI